MNPWAQLIAIRNFVVLSIDLCERPVLGPYRDDVHSVDLVRLSPASCMTGRIFAIPFPSEAVVWAR